MNVQREAEVDYEKVVQQFPRLHPRKLYESCYFRLHTFFEVHPFL